MSSVRSPSIKGGDNGADVAFQAPTAQHTDTSPFAMTLGHILHCRVIVPESLLVCCGILLRLVQCNCRHYEQQRFPD